jgi:hypothetical protein
MLVLLFVQPLQHMYVSVPVDEESVCTAVQHHCDQFVESSYLKNDEVFNLLLELYSLTSPENYFLKLMFISIMSD